LGRHPAGDGQESAAREDRRRGFDHHPAAREEPVLSGERSLLRKGQEAILTAMLEAAMDKRAFSRSI